jgi:hypothetical protein
MHTSEILAIKNRLYLLPELLYGLKKIPNLPYQLFVRSLSVVFHFCIIVEPVLNNNFEVHFAQ